MAEAPPDPKRAVSTIHKLSRYQVDHPDYAGLTQAEKRRAITKRLRMCNFSVVADQLSTENRNKIRATVPAPVAGNGFPGYHIGTQANGIVWCRCTLGRSEEGVLLEGNYCPDNTPVIFDVYTGNSVAPYPGTSQTTASSGEWSRVWNDDEFFVVGKTMGTAVKTKANADFRLEEWMVPVQLIPQNPINEFYNRSAFAYATLLAGPNTYPYATGGGGQPATAKRRRPAVDEWYNYGIDPCGNDSDGGYEPGWADLQVWALQHSDADVGSYDGPVDPGERRHQQVSRGIARVFNYTPFGYRVASGLNYQFLKVINAGDFYIVDRPLYATAMPWAKAIFEARVPNTSGELVFTAGNTGPSGGLDYKSMSLLGESIIGTKDPSSSARTHYYLPRTGVRHNVTVELAWTCRYTGSGEFLLPSMPVQTIIYPFGQAISWSTWNLPSTNQASVTPVTASFVPLPRVGVQFKTFGSFGSPDIGPSYHSYTSFISNMEYLGGTLSSREFKILIYPPTAQDFFVHGEVTITPIW